MSILDQIQTTDTLDFRWDQLTFTELQLQQQQQPFAATATPLREGVPQDFITDHLQSKTDRSVSPFTNIPWLQNASALCLNVVMCRVFHRDPRSAGRDLDAHPEFRDFDKIACKPEAGPASAAWGGSLGFLCTGIPTGDDDFITDHLQSKTDRSVSPFTNIPWLQNVSALCFKVVKCRVFHRDPRSVELDLDAHPEFRDFDKIACCAGIPIGDYDFITDHLQSKTDRSVSPFTNIPWLQNVSALCLYVASKYGIALLLQYVSQLLPPDATEPAYGSGARGRRAGL